jgi:hypothetical protein
MVRIANLKIGTKHTSGIHDLEIIAQDNVY